MNRKVMLAANWKMNLNSEKAEHLCKQIVKRRKEFKEIDVVLFPSFIYIPDSVKIIRATQIGIGGQDICFEREGAFTGEVAAYQLKDVGCTHVLIGHSERRHYFHEDYETVNKKIILACENSLKVILCVGESLQEKEQGITEMVVVDQIVSAFQNIPQESCPDIVIAYEPIWAIGTGKTATPEDAGHVHQIIRKTLERTFNKEVAENTRILYGGSVKPDNVASLIAQDNIDGALIGGASLEEESLFQLIENAS